MTNAISHQISRQISRKIKLCIVSDSFYPYICGVTIAISKQAKALTELGFEVHIVFPKSKKAVSLSKDIYLHPVKHTMSSKKFDQLYIKFPSTITYKTLSQIEPDIIHVHTQAVLGIEAISYAKLKKIPCVGTSHTFFSDVQYLQTLGLKPAILWSRLVNRYESLFYSRLDEVITPSKALLKEIHLPKRVHSQVISGGISQPLLVSKKKIMQLRKKYNLPRKKYILIYIGRVSIEKSIDVLCEACTGLDDVHLVVIGGGSTLEPLKLAYPQVTFLGPMSHDKIINLNLPRLGDVFVTASTTENQPVSILEALVMGVPVIGPKSRGIPELITNDKNGLLFSPGNIAQLRTAIYHSKKHNAKLSAGAFESAKQHSITTVAKQLSDVYMRLLSRKKK